jgi:predicted kinase
MMEAVIFIGLQASGKSTFYTERFFATHLRINLDMLKTRHRERALTQTCISLRQPFVIDNTNPTVADRAIYIAAAKADGFRALGYFFQSQVAACIQRNEARSGRAHVPAKAIAGTSRRLQLPTYDEGFDALFFVRIDPAGGFIVEEWRAEETQ